MIYKSRHLILFILCYNVIPIICDIEAFLKGNFEQELFGDGEFHIRDKVNMSLFMSIRKYEKVI